MSLLDRPCSSLPFCALVANAALLLLNLACHLLDRQMDAQARCFEQGGGLRERLYRVRTARRSDQLPKHHRKT